MAKKVMRELDCVLSQEEKGLIGIKACEERDKARELKEQASALEKSAKEKEHQVAQGKTRRKVECIEIPNFANNETRIERTDERVYWTGDTPIVEVRAMSGDERQTLIDVDRAPGTDMVTTTAPKGRKKKSD